MTSEELADCAGTNEVVVRRQLALPRDLGYVTSSRGRGHGWEMARDPNEITLRALYDAIGAKSLFAISLRGEVSTCLLNQTVDSLLSSTLDDMEALFLNRLSQITLADVAESLPAHYHFEENRNDAERD